MTIQFRAALAGDSGSTGSTTQVVTLPTGWQAGDFCVIAGRIGNSSVTFTTPTGWTIINTGGNSSGGYSYCFYYRVLQAGDSNPTFTSSVSSTWNWESLGLYSDVGAALSFDTQGTETDTTTGGSTFTPPAATASGSGEASVIVMVGRSTTQVSPTGSSTTPASGWTTGASDAALLNANGNTRVGANYYQLGVSGTVTPGSFTFTLTGVTTSLDFSSQQVLVSEAPTGGAYGQYIPPTMFAPLAGRLGPGVPFQQIGSYPAPAPAAAVQPVNSVTQLKTPAIRIKPGQYLRTGMLPGTGLSGIPPQHPTALRTPPIQRQPKKSVATGMLPGQGLSGIPPSAHLRSRQQRLVPIRAQYNRLTPGSRVPPVYVPQIRSKPASIQHAPKQQVRTGMLLGQGLSGIPPLAHIRPRAAKLIIRPRGAITGPFQVPPVLPVLVTPIPRRGPPRAQKQQYRASGFVQPPGTQPVQPQQTVLAHTQYRLKRQPRQYITTGFLPGKGLSGIPESLTKSYPTRLQRAPRQYVARGERGSLTVPAPKPVAITIATPKLRRQPKQSINPPPFVPAGIVYQPVSAPTHIASTFYRLRRQPRQSIATGMLPGKGLSGIPESQTQYKIPRLRRQPPQRLTYPQFVTPPGTQPTQPEPTILVRTFYRLRRQPRQYITTGMLPGKGLSGIPESPVKQPSPSLRRQPPQKLQRGEPASLTHPVPYPVVLRIPAKLQKQPKQTTRTGMLPAPVYATPVRQQYLPRKVQRQPRQQTRTGWPAWGIIPVITPGRVRITNQAIPQVQIAQQSPKVQITNQSGRAS